MKCEICKKDPDTLILLPIKQPNGKYETVACLECSLESGHYCNVHSSPHIGFGDETSACVKCIEELVETQGERVAGVFAVKAKESSNYYNIDETLQDYLDCLNDGLVKLGTADLPLARRILDSNIAQNISRPLITYSLRKKIGITDAIEYAISNPDCVF